MCYCARYGVAYQAKRRWVNRSECRPMAYLSFGVGHGSGHGDMAQSRCWRGSFIDPSLDEGNGSARIKVDFDHFPTGPAVFIQPVNTLLAFGLYVSGSFHFVIWTVDLFVLKAFHFSTCSLARRPIGWPVCIGLLIPAGMERPLAASGKAPDLDISA